MRDNHIIKMLEERAIDSLSEGEMVVIEAHAAGCSACLRAYEAARISADLLRARASERVEPSPFFKTRVMAAIRERHLSPEAPALLRMWRAAGALVSMMAVLVVVLIGLTVFSNSAGTHADELMAGNSLYSPEYVVLEPGSAGDDSLAYDQVLSTVYDLGDFDGQ
jgi:predicted anti-sigma-YlaC factor YlaD